MKNIFLLLLILNIFMQLNAQVTKRLSNINPQSFEAFYFIQKTEGLVIDYLKIEEDDPVPYDRLNEFYQIDKETFLNYIQQHIILYSKKEQNAIIDSVIIWSQMTELINFPFQLEKTMLTEFQQIIANINSTKHLINRNLNYEGQYWGSLSSSQVTEVYFDLMDYLLHLNSEDKLLFFKNYYELTYEIGKNED